MPDHISITTPAGPTPVATDEVAGVHYQRFKAAFGADGTATDVSANAGMPITGSYRELTGSASANNSDLISATDVRGFSIWYAQISGTFSGTTCVAQASSDGTNWINVNSLQLWSNTTSFVSMNSVSYIYYGPLPLRYFRVRTAAWSSGTITINMQLSNTVMPFVYAPTAPQAIQGDRATGFSDALVAPGSSNTWGAVCYAYNGANWDRIRNVAAVDGVAATTGLQAAGLIGYDGSNNRRVRTDTTGVLYQRPLGVPTSTVVPVPAATASTVLFAAKTSRTQAKLYNDSTSVLYLKEGTGASSTSFSCKVGPAGYWELPSATTVYTGVIEGAWETATGTAMATEIG